jgi:hypothetical protein
MVKYPRAVETARGCPLLTVTIVAAAPTTVIATVAE